MSKVGLMHRNDHWPAFDEIVRLAPKSGAPSALLSRSPVRLAANFSPPPPHIALSRGIQAQKDLGPSEANCSLPTAMEVALNDYPLRRVADDRLCARILDRPQAFTKKTLGTCGARILPFDVACLGSDRTGCGSARARYLIWAPRRATSLNLRIS